MEGHFSYRAGENSAPELKPYLSPLGIWALSFGTAVGWGSFVMPATTFMPTAGPLGTVLGFLAGIAIMILIGVNYFYLMQKYPTAEGSYGYAKEIFNHDHGFLCAWFLLLTYISIIWANASALPIIVRSLFGSHLQVGFHYVFAGYDVYMGEVALSIAAIVAAGLLCAYVKKGAVKLQILAALGLILGIFLFFALTENSHDASYWVSMPQFADESHPMMQIFWISMLTPWAFVGFESVSHSSQELAFPMKKMLKILILAVVTSGAAYIMLTVVAVGATPAEYGNWTEYLADLDNQEGLRRIPALCGATRFFGSSGPIIAGAVVLCGILTGLIGNMVASGRVLYSMAKDGVFGKYFCTLDKSGNPRDAILFVMILSLPVTFLGRTAIGWIVDVTVVCATVIYGYTSAATYRKAGEEGRKGLRIAGAVGTVISLIFIFFILVPGFRFDGQLSTESYFMLTVWAVIGIFVFKRILRLDKSSRYGNSIVVWILLSTLIMSLSFVWSFQTMDRAIGKTSSHIAYHFAEEEAELVNGVGHEVEAEVISEEHASQHLKEVMASLGKTEKGCMTIQVFLMCLILYALTGIYGTMNMRAKQMALEKSEAASKAKSDFLFNMSHDIRTPMNAVMGYTQLARQDGTSDTQLHEYLEKIHSSSQYMLQLINNVLEMSKIESGQLEEQVEDTDIRKVLVDVSDIFAIQMQEKGLRFTARTEGLTHPVVKCDPTHLERVLMNLLSNSLKFTESGGEVELSVCQKAEGAGDIYEIKVKDTGIGMSHDFVEHIFDAFTMERTSTASGIRGAGLGMALTRSYVELMGGTITVNTEQGEGTEFLLKIPFPVVRGKEAPAEEAMAVVYDGSKEAPITESAAPSGEKPLAEPSGDSEAKKLLLVEDNDINREIAAMILETAGFEYEEAENGQIAVDRLKASAHGEFAAVLMDIQMPVMDGLQATRAIRALEDPVLAKIPIIAVTANAFDEDIRREKEAGMDGHITKPINMELLLEAIEQYS